MVLVTCFLHLFSFSTKGSNPSLFLFHTKIGLKQVTFILTETILCLVFFARPIDDEVNTLEMTAGNVFN